MHDRLLGTLDLADSTLAGAAGFVPAESLDGATRLVARARSRLAYPDDLSVVALVGGTGSGKSSLFNRILEREVADVGGIRPTTTTPLASTPDSRREEIDSYIGSLGDVRRTSHRGLPWLALIDLPDTDSVELDHRLQVEALLPKVDVVVWVADVEKYRDDALHRGRIRPLRAYQDQFLFVLNQVDRVPKAEIADLVADFEAGLTEDGIDEPLVVAIAANPPLTPPFNIEELRIALRDRATRSVLRKVLNDLEVAMAALGDGGAGGSLEFEQRWEPVRDDAARAVADGDLVGSGRRLAHFFASLAEELWGEAAEAALELSAHAGEDVMAIVDSLLTDPAAASPPSRLRWSGGRAVRSKHTKRVEATAVAHELDWLISSRLRPLLRRRAVVVADLAALSVAVAESRSLLDR